MSYLNEQGILSHIRLVLVETSHPGNIGSCARAMKTMGLEHLVLVNPKHFPHQEAYELAAGADDVLDRAQVVSSLEEALAGCVCVMVTSARARSLALPGFTPRQAAQHAVHRAQQATSVAIVLGRERIGLTNPEILQGHYHIFIPANPLYTSLNLAQAAQIIAYELRMEALDPGVCVAMKTEPLADHTAYEQFYMHLQQVLYDIGFLKPEAPRRLMERMRRMFGRIQLEVSEMNLLRGMLTRVQWTLRHEAGKPKE